jgi:hypothetical protein
MSETRLLTAATMHWLRFVCLILIWIVSRLGCGKRLMISHRHRQQGHGNAQQLAAMWRVAAIGEFKLVDFDPFRRYTTNVI